jgi:hypothetical protein
LGASRRIKQLDRRLQSAHDTTNHAVTDQEDAETGTRGTRHPGLGSRILGVLFSPRRTFGDIVRRPRWLGALLLMALVVSGATGWLVSTEVGQQALLEQQVSAMESFGVSVSDEIYAQLESRLESAM